MTKEKRPSLPGYSKGKREPPVQVNSTLVTAYANSGGKPFRHPDKDGNYVLVTPRQAREALKPFFSAADITNISEGKFGRILGKSKFRMLANKGGLVKEQPKLSKAKKSTVQKVTKGLNKASKLHADQAKKLKGVIK
jgi:hypothetical protein